jgi:hypothetical protein
VTSPKEGWYPEFFQVGLRSSSRFFDAQWKSAPWLEKNAKNRACNPNVNPTIELISPSSQSPSLESAGFFWMLAVFVAAG